MSPTIAQDLRKRQPDVEVLYISGFTGDAIAQQGVLDPGVHFLSKPFGLGRLHEKVRRILDG